MAADLNKPVSTDLYTQILTDIRDMQAALAKMNHSSTANLPVGAIQWSDANSRLEKWNGSAWVALMPDATTSAKGLTQLSTSTASTSTTLAATASAVKSVKDSVNNLNFTNIAGTATAGQVPNIESLSGNLTDSQLGRSPQLTGHVRAGNTQLISGTTSVVPSSSDMYVSAGTVADTDRTIGRTGQGKEVSWKALDILPSNAKILIAKLSIKVIGVERNSGTYNDMDLTVFFGDSVTPISDVAGLSELANIDFRTYGDGTVIANDAEDFGVEMLVMIPLNDRAFSVKWRTNATSGTRLLRFYYRGFITD